jgi:polyisoprenyl-phosphate glycosyltransferase
MSQDHVNISIVVPVYKEEANIRPFLQRTEATLERMGLSHEIIFSMDPGPDRTEDVICEEMARNPRIKLITYSRRFGQPAATLGGLFNCTGRTCVIIDVDLQDPPELIEQLYSKLAEGYEVVYAKRRSRQGETLIKRVVAYLGYALINRLAEVEIPRDTGDFRIMTRRVIEQLRTMPESHGFLRGLVAHIGFKQAFVEYDRHSRHAGAGHYNRLIGSLKIGLNGIVSFSGRPLQLMSVAGILLAGFSFLLGAWYAVQHFIGMPLTAGLPTTVLVVTFFSGVQLLALGVMGEYVGRIYEEVKRRPMYIVDRKLNFTCPDEHHETSRGG